MGLIAKCVRLFFGEGRILRTIPLVDMSGINIPMLKNIQVPRSAQ